MAFISIKARASVMRLISTIVDTGGGTLREVLPPHRMNLVEWCDVLDIDIQPHNIAERASRTFHSLPQALDNLLRLGTYVADSQQLAVLVLGMPAINSRRPPRVSIAGDRTPLALARPFTSIAFFSLSLTRCPPYTLLKPNWQLAAPLQNKRQQ